MSVWIAAFLLVPLADQAIKALLRQQLGDRVVSLGPLGSALESGMGWVLESALGLRLRNRTYRFGCAS